MPLTLLSFDVDGTLIHSIGERANKLHKDAFIYGFKSACGLDTHIDVVKHHGSTDPLICIAVMMYHGISKEEALAKLPEVKAAMNSYFMEKAAQDAGTGIELLPGVLDLLNALADMPAAAATCLVTGNLEPIGWAKMQALGILELFTKPRFGGFGSDLCSGNTEESWRDRRDLVSLAAVKGSQLLPGAEEGFAARYHIGDTPMDIQAALAAGAKAVGVTTGIYSREELLAAAPPGTPPGALLVLDSLEDTSAVLKAFGLDK
ncbi:HAD-like domain-containing protein [Haematococcus lacustris]